MEKGTPEQLARVMNAFLKMKKFDLEELRKAYRGEGMKSKQAIRCSS